MIRARGSGDPLDQGNQRCAPALSCPRDVAPRGALTSRSARGLYKCRCAPPPPHHRPSPARPPPPAPCRHGAGTLYWCGSQHHACATSQASVGEDMFEPSPRAVRTHHTQASDGQRRDSMVSGMAQRRGHCDDASEASLPPDGDRGVVTFGENAVMVVDTLHAAPVSSSGINMRNIIPKSKARTPGLVASHASHHAPMTARLLLPVEEAPATWCASGSPQTGGVHQRLHVWTENCSVLIALSLMKECQVQLPKRAAPNGEPNKVMHHVSMLPRLAWRGCPD